jgi:type III secretion protein U
VSEKTEPPTPRRLQRAAADGDGGASTVLAQALAFFAVVLLVPAAGAAVALRARALLVDALARAANGDAGDAAMRAADGALVARDVVLLAAPLLAAGASGAAAAVLVQTGGVFAPRVLGPRLDRLDVVAGLRGLVSGPRLFAVVRALVAALVAARLVVLALEAVAADLTRTVADPRLAIQRTAALVASAAATLALRAALVGLVIGALDVVVTRASWRKRLFMTRDEVKREQREQEGDGHVKAQRKRAHQEVLTANVLAGVRNATVVIANPTHRACALRYAPQADEGDAAPVVVASGEGDLAMQILRAARDYGVPVLQDIPLAQALLALEVGEAIPEELYEAVAEILREVWAEALASEGAPASAMSSIDDVFLKTRG